MTRRLPLLLVSALPALPACLDLNPGEVDPVVLAEQNEPEFACVDTQGAARRLVLAAGGVARTQVDGVGEVSTGTWALAADGTMTVDVAGELTDTFATVTTFGMILQMKGEGHGCASFHYAGDDGRDATFACTSLNQPGTVFETTTVGLTAREGLLLGRETVLQGGDIEDALTRSFAGVYRVENDQVFAAWGNDDDEIETLVGAFDGDDLVVAAFDEPRCPRQ